MSVFLGHTIYLMCNWIGFMNFLELCCQWKIWNGIFLASWSQAGTWTFCVHPWRLRSMHPWWWDMTFRWNNALTWRGHMELVMKTCRGLPLTILYDIGMYWGKRFGPIWTNFLRYNGGFCHCLLLEGLLFSLNYLSPWKISGIVSQLRPFRSRWCWKMALGVLVSSRHGIIHALQWWYFMRKNCRRVDYCVGKIQRNLSLVILLFWWYRRDGTNNGSLRDLDTIPLLHGMPTCLSQSDFHGWRLVCQAG